MRSVAIGCLLLAASCSKAPEQAETASYDVQEAPAAPGINVTAAPGVAFTYRYAFRLPAANIGRAQEAHAAACEKLGVVRCRITGMRYTLDRNNHIAASLAFKLDPALARAFGREGIAAIERSEGMLVDAEISGTDAGAEIDRLNATSSTLRQDRARLNREIAGTNGAAARAELLRQREALDEQERTAAATRSDQQASLARTPMSFDYESGQAIRGFDPRSPFADAADLAIGSAEWTLAFVLSALALLTPPALAFLLLFLLWRRVFPLVRPRVRAQPAEA